MLVKTELGETTSQFGSLNIRWENTRLHRYSYVEIGTSSSNTLNLKVFVLLKLTQIFPSRKVDHNLFEKHQVVNYADPQFSKSGRIDMILGVDVFQEIFLEKKITLSKSLAVRETVFSGSCWRQSSEGKETRFGTWWLRNKT